MLMLLSCCGRQWQTASFLFLVLWSLVDLFTLDLEKKRKEIQCEEAAKLVWLRHCSYCLSNWCAKWVLSGCGNFMLVHSTALCLAQGHISMDEQFSCSNLQRHSSTSLSQTIGAPCRFGMFALAWHKWLWCDYLLFHLLPRLYHITVYKHTHTNLPHAKT